MILTYYTYDNKGILTGGYTSEASDDISLEDIALPKNTTLVEPPNEINENEMLRFNVIANTWDVIPDTTFPTTDAPFYMLLPDWIDGHWVDTATPSQIAEHVLEVIANDRWVEETGGVTINGIQIKTDDRSQFKLAMAVMQAQANPSYIVQWKAANGWVMLDATTIFYISSVVQQFVTGCYIKEAQLTATIENILLDYTNEVITEDEAKLSLYNISW